MVKQSIKQIHYLQYNEYKTTCEICCTLIVREIAKFGITMEEEETAGDSTEYDKDKA